MNHAHSLSADLVGFAVLGAISALLCAIFAIAATGAEPETAVPLLTLLPAAFFGVLALFSLGGAAYCGWKMLPPGWPGAGLRRLAPALLRGAATGAALGAVPALTAVRG